MYEAWAGDSPAVAQALTLGWKAFWYQETPTAGTMYWLMKGYNDYFMIHGNNR